MPNLRTFHSRPSMVAVIGSWRLVAVLLFLAAAGDGICESSVAAEKSTKGNSKLEDNVDAADEADADLDADLVVPARFLGKLKETDRQKFSQEMRGLLMEGFKTKGDGLDAAKKHFESARRLVADDPRAPYAYGLALLAHDRSLLALEQFRAAAKQKHLAYLPALQAIAWLNVSRGDHAQALPALSELAHKLEESQESWPAAEDKEHSAEWLGRMIGFLEGPAKSSAQSAATDKLAAEVASLLSDERKQAYERGHDDVARRYTELQAAAARPEAELLAAAKEQRKHDIEAADEARNEIKILEGELRDLKKPVDKKLADRSREIRSNATRIKTATSRLGAAEAEVEKYSEPKMHASIRSQGNRRPTRLVTRPENAGEKKIRESELSSAQKALDRLHATVDEAKQAMTDARKHRDEVQAEFRKAAAGKRQALQAAQHKAADLAAHARDAEHGALTPEKLQARVTALDSYVPLHPDLEQARLLGTLKPAT